MPPGHIVEPFNLRHDVLPRLLAGLIALAVDPLGLERAEETLHRGVIEAVTCAAHADRETMRLQNRLILSTGILDAVIGMMNLRNMVTPGYPEGIKVKV